MRTHERVSSTTSERRAEERHAEIYFIKENLRFTDDTNNPFNKLTLQIIGSIAEFERNMIKMRQKEGIAIAKKKGVYSKERCKKLSLSKIELIPNIFETSITPIPLISNKFARTSGALPTILCPK